MSFPVLENCKYFIIEAPERDHRSTENVRASVMCLLLYFYSIFIFTINLGWSSCAQIKKVILIYELK